MKQSMQKHVKRVARIIAGFALLLAGIAMLVLPGPGWVTIALGLAMLSKDFPWARHALDRIKEVGRKGLEIARGWWERRREKSSDAM